MTRTAGRAFKCGERSYGPPTPMDAATFAHPSIQGTVLGIYGWLATGHVDYTYRIYEGYTTVGHQT